MVKSNKVRCSERKRHVRPSKHLSIDFAVQWTALPCNILFLKKVIDEDACHVVGVGQNYRHFHALKREERVDTSHVTFNSFTAIGAYMRQLIERASLLVYNFSEFCPLTTFDS